MSKIISIGTSVPEYKHSQHDILEFMQRVYALTETDSRKLKFLYRQGGIDQRYSVIPDYSLPADEWTFYPPTENLEPFPKLEKRMQWFQQYAASLSMQAINACMAGQPNQHITHLVTVSCTGMSNPGLDSELVSLLQLPGDTIRTSVNFMGCYAAVHALKLADAFCKADEHARVLIVCTELCTLHFQKENTVDNITSSMLFGDGSAAVLVTNEKEQLGIEIGQFYGTLAPQGSQDMAWQLSSKGFLMTLSSYVADLIEQNFDSFTAKALTRAGMVQKDITQWCIHPGGKKILEAVHKSLALENGDLDASYDILKSYGNMSSPTVLFILKNIMNRIQKDEKIFMAAFGPGITMESLILTT